MKQTTLTILRSTAEDIQRFNSTLYAEEMEAGDIKQAIHRQTTTMAQIEGLKSFVIRLKVADQITERGADKIQTELHKIWRIILNWGKS